MRTGKGQEDVSMAKEEDGSNPKSAAEEEVVENASLASPGGQVTGALDAIEGEEWGREGVPGAGEVDGERKPDNWRPGGRSMPGGPANGVGATVGKKLVIGR